METRVIAPLSLRLGAAGYSCPSSPPKRRAERLGVSPRPRRHVQTDTWRPWVSHESHGSRVPLEGHTARLPRGSRPQKQDNACVPHAPVFSACNSRRSHVLGLLTECLARHIAGSSGRPPRLRVIVLSHLCGARLTGARPTKGPQTRRVRRIPPHAGDETGAPLGWSGTGGR